MKRLQEVLQGKGENYIFPFFWLHGENEDLLREYMNAIYNSNIRAVCLESRPHPDFCGPKWWEDLSVIIDEAKKLDMKVWILDDSHFPTGFANGAIETAPDELTHQYMVKRTLDISGPAYGAEFELAEYMKDAPLPPWIPPRPQPKRLFHDDRLVAIVACPIMEGSTLGEPIDLTGNICPDGMVRFDLPAGYYRIYVIRLTRNAAGRNDYINFMDEESCRLLLDAVYEPHYAHFKEDFGKTILGFFSDEPPIGNTEGYIPAGPIGSPDQNLPWSRRAADALTEEFGSADWKKYIPLLWAEGFDKTQQAKIRSAYMNMVTRLVQECFSAQNGRWCEEHGVKYIGHMLEDVDMNSDLGISMGHYFRGLSGQHMAGIDNIGGQVTICGQDYARHDKSDCPDEAGFYHYTMAKLGVSHASIDPKKEGRCLCENMGAYGWQSGTKEEKFMMDHFMVRGVNRFVPHAFSPAPFPDSDCPPHFYAHGENPLYRAFGQLMAYSNRICQLIDGGHGCPDVALLYNGESKWAGGGQSNIPATRALTCGQVDFHIIPTDVFREDDEYPCSFDGNQLIINGVSYGALLISGCDFIEKPAADFVIRAARSGYPVIWLDKKVHGVSDGTPADAAALAEAVSGQICVPAEQAAEAVRKIFLPQVTLAPASRRMTTYHYSSDADYYLLFNEDAGEKYCGNVELNSADFQSAENAGTPAADVPAADISSSGKRKFFLYDPWENQLYRAAADNSGNVCDAASNPATVIKIPVTLNPLQMLILIAADADAAVAADPAFTAVPVFAADSVVNASASDASSSIREVSTMKVRRIAARDYLFRKAEALSEAEIRTVTAPYRGMQVDDPFFSGYYIYEAFVSAEEGRPQIVSIDQVGEACEIFWNGVSLGMKLQAPFTFRIPGDKVKAENELRIEAATLLERKVKGMGLDITCMSNHRPLSANGIVGKVFIYGC